MGRGRRAGDVGGLGSLPGAPPGGDGGATEPRLCLGSHHAAFSRNFDVTHMWGKGLGERKETAGEGGGAVGSGVAAQALRGSQVPKHPLSAAVKVATQLQSLVPCPQPSSTPQSSPPPSTLIFIYFFTLKSRPALCSRKKLVPLVCGTVLLVPDVRPSIAIAGGDGQRGASETSLHPGRQTCVLLLLGNRVLCLLSHAGFFHARPIPPCLTAHSI